MTTEEPDVWESRLSGSERGRSSTMTMVEIQWHRRESRRQTENTNFDLPSGRLRPTRKRRKNINA